MRRLTKCAAISMMLLSITLQSFEAAARVGGGRAVSSMSSSRSSYAAPQRVGNGGNAGMQRPDVMDRARTQDTAPQAAPAPQAMGNTVPQQQAGRPGFGVGSMVGAAAAGAAVGYLANSAMHDGSRPASADNGYPPASQASNPADENRTSPWSFILMLLAGTAVIMGGLMLLSRRREAEATPSAVQARSSVTPIAGGGASEQQEFERNALKFFNDLQEANNRGDIAHMEEHTAEPIRQALIADIQNRTAPSATQTVMMKAERIDLTEEAERSIASVRFRGMVSENANAAPDQLDEVWHFVRSRDADSRWLLAGIEQV